MLHSSQSPGKDLTGADGLLAIYWHKRVVALLSCAALAVGLLTTGGGTAHAIDEWSDPVTVNGPVTSNRSPSVAISEDGSRALAVWEGRIWGVSYGLYAAWWTDGVWEPPTHLGLAYSLDSEQPDASIALSGDGSRATIVWDQCLGPDEEGFGPEPCSVQWTGWTGNDWTPAAPLDDGNGVGGSVSMSADGKTVLASWVWERHEVRTAQFAGGTWTAPETVATGSSYRDTTVSVAAKQSGQAMLSWIKRTRVNMQEKKWVETSHWDNGVWSPAQQISRACTNPVLKMSANGSRAFQIWGGRDREALRGAVWRSGSWGPAEKIGKVGVDPGIPCGPQTWWSRDLAVSAGGKRAIAMWHNDEDDRDFVRSAIWRGGDWGSSTRVGRGVFARVGLAGGEATTVWDEGPGTGIHPSVRSKVMPRSTWREYQKIGTTHGYGEMSFALAADGSTGMAVWEDDGVGSALLERYGKARKVRFKVRKKSANRSRVKVTWAQPDYATRAKVKFSKPNRKKFASGWKSVTKPVYRTTVKRGKKYWVKIRVVTKAGNGPAVTKPFRS